MLALQLVLAGSLAHAADIDLAGARIVVAEKAGDMEVFAARELSRYFRLICGKESPVAKGRPGSKAVATVVVGTAASLDEDPGTLREQGYRLRVLPVKAPWLVISARTPIGVQYGVYSLLEKLGVGFYLGGDALPKRRGSLLIPADLNEQREPVFAIRGSLPWYNFLNSPTTWDLEDYRVFFDQMAKMKDNFVGFHSYDHEPFGAYPYQGQWRMGQPAATSATYWWGALGRLKTDEFGFGTGRCFPYEVFGSRSAVLAEKPKEPASRGAGDLAREQAIFPQGTLEDDTIVRAQCVLAQGLQYAKLRGVKTCFGFELVGDPTDPEQRRQEEARIRHTLATYPMIDYLWFWQSEGLGGGSKPAAPDSPLDLIAQRYRPVFEYLGNENRTAEAARVAAWVEWGHGLVKRLRPDLKVIVSGWGGDAWMRFSDFYVGLDKVLPKDIIFSALDNIDPTSQDHVSEAYGKLSPDREKWPIPWFSSDGGGTRRDQWGPQCNVKPFTALVRDAQRKGCEGLLGIHWETRGIEEVAAYCAQFAWDPDLTYEQFYQTFARACYGEKYGPEMAQVHMRLEALGPRWTGGPGQVECGGFQWFSDDRRPRPENLAALKEIAARLEAIREDGPTYTAWERLNYLKATVDFVQAFDEAALILAPDGPVEKLLQQAEAAKAAGKTEEASRLAEQAVGEMRRAPLGRAMQSYTRRLTTQGDFGNLATLNVKAYIAFRNLWQRAEAVLGGLRPLPTAESSRGLLVVARRPPSAAAEGVPFPVQAVACTERVPDRVVLHYRKPGHDPREEGAATSVGPDGRRQIEVHKFVVLRRVGERTFEGAIPARDMGPDGVDYQLQVYPQYHEPRPGWELPKPLGFWPDVAEYCSLTTMPHAAPAVYGPCLQRQVALAPWGGAEPAALRATALSATEYEACQAEARIGGAVEPGRMLYHLALFPLAAAALDQPRLTAAARAQDALGHRAAGPVTDLAAPPAPPAPTAVAAEIAGPYLARVTWAPVPGAATYELHRSAEPGFTPSEQTRIASWPWATYDDVGLRSNMTYEWAVAAVNDAGQRGPFARTRDLFIPDQPPAKPPTNVVATPGLGRVTLTWQRPEQPVSGFAVFTVGDEGERRVSGEAPVRETRYVVGGLADTERRRYLVRAVDRGGRLGLPTAEVSAAALPVPWEPVLAASFSSARAETGQEGKLGGKATLHDGVLDIRQGGWIAYPGEELLQVSGPLTVEVWVNIDRVQGIPVLLSFGHWEGPGYWLQLFGNGTRWYLPVQRILDTAPIPVGAWHHVCCTYDGRMSRVYLDGKEVGARDLGPVDLAPWPGELRIGQYSDLEDQFQTLGQVDAVRLYQRALSAEEVRQGFEKGR